MIAMNIFLPLPVYIGAEIFCYKMREELLIGRLKEVYNSAKLRIDVILYMLSYLV